MKTLSGDSECFPSKTHHLARGDPNVFAVDRKSSEAPEASGYMYNYVQSDNVGTKATLSRSKYWEGIVT